jgi:beta-lactamase regulating signal transducer with metallopeptidase domain
VIVVSRCLADALDEGEMAMVLHHEATHVRHRHGRMLRRITALEAAFGHLPGFKRAAHSTRLAIERWADETAIEEAGCDRVVATRALLKATSVTPSATPSLSNVDSILQRLAALANPPAGSRVWHGLLAGAGLLATGMFGVVGFYSWVSHGHAALALAGWCPT